MGTHVALLRGINVGTAKPVSMETLREVVAGLGYGDVRTLLRSGNVVFTSAARLREDAAEELEAALLAATGVRSSFVLLRAEELAEVVDANPLLGVATDPARLLVTFFSRPLDPRALAGVDLAAYAPDAVALGPRAVYSWHPDGVSRSRLPAAFWSRFGSVGTARNWRTVGKLTGLPS